LNSLRIILRTCSLGLYLGLFACSGGGGESKSEESVAPEELVEDIDSSDNSGESAEVDPSEPPNLVQTYSVGGTVTGVSGSSIIIQNNGSDSLVLSADGSFNFESQLTTGDAYSVSVAQSLTNPNITCYVSGASGLVSTSDIESVSIICPSLQRIEISSNYSSISTDGEIEFYLTGIYSYSIVRDLTPYASWSSADESLASVDASGVMSPVADGLVSIRANYRGQNASKAVTINSATISSISITPPSASLTSGGLLDFRATGIYSDGSTRDLTRKVTWSSSDSAVSVDDSVTKGRITGVSAGSATITADYGAVSSTASASVSAASLSSIEISPVISSASVGVTTQFYATGINDDSSHDDITSFVNWSSSDSSIASIDSDGLLSRHLVGSVTISATYAAVSAQVSASVLGATLSEIEISPDAFSMPAGILHNYVATGIYTDGSREDLSDQVIWSSSDSAVASIDNGASSKGLVEALSAGSSTIGATYASISKTTSLSVSGNTIVSLRVEPESVLMTNDLNKQFTLIGLDSDSNEYDLTEQALWQSSNAVLGLMSNLDGSKGLLNNLYDGSVNASSTITASYQGLSAAASVMVAPATVSEIWINPVSIEVSTMSSTQFSVIANFDDGASMDVTSYVTWASEDSLVASVSNAYLTPGLVSALSEGTTNIKAILGSHETMREIVVGNGSSNATQIAGTGLTASYYNNRTLDPSGLAGVRLDSTVDYNWAIGSAPLGVGDNFSVKYEGYILADYSEDYIFCTDSDDGLRLYIDGVLVIDDWTDHATREGCTTPIALTAGNKHSVKLEFYEKGGYAVIRLKWRSSSQTSDLKQVIDQRHLFSN
jgi:uncharacterized protein YjdB